MQLYEAKADDILRCSQRDELFINEAEEQIQTLCRLIGATNNNRTRITIPIIVKLWYYLMTSLSNLQTLGEEYTGIIRVNKHNKIPSKLVQILWLVLHVGGESILERLLTSINTKINKSETLTNNAKLVFLASTNFLSKHKSILKKIHHSIFYTKGRYYHISNRVTNLRYALIRQWLEDDTFSASFNLLGNISLFYIFFNFVQQAWLSHNGGKVSENNEGHNLNISKRHCAICGEHLKSASTTSCGHIFCWNCIYESLDYQVSCPVCRRDINPSRIVLLQNFN